MCAPPIVSRPSPPPTPAPSKPVKTGQAATVRRVGKTLRQASPSQRGRGVLIRSKSPLGINPNTAQILGTRKSLLTPITVPVDLTFGGY